MFGGLMLLGLMTAAAIPLVMSPYNEASEEELPTIEPEEPRDDLAIDSTEAAPQIEGQTMTHVVEPGFQKLANFDESLADLHLILPQAAETLQVFDATETTDSHIEIISSNSSSIIAFPTHETVPIFNIFVQISTESDSTPMSLVDLYLEQNVSDKPPETAADLVDPGDASLNENHLPEQIKLGKNSDPHLSAESILTDPETPDLPSQSPETEPIQKPIDPNLADSVDTTQADPTIEPLAPVDPEVTDVMIVEGFQPGQDVLHLSFPAEGSQHEPSEIRIELSENGEDTIIQVDDHPTALLPKTTGVTSADIVLSSNAQKT